MPAGLQPTVDFEDNFLFLDEYTGDLNLVAHTGGGAEIEQILLPFISVILSVAVKDERLLRTRQCDLAFGEFRHEPTRNIHAFVEAELVRIGRAGTRHQHKEPG